MRRCIESLVKKMCVVSCFLKFRQRLSFVRTLCSRAFWSINFLSRDFNSSKYKRSFSRFLLCRTFKFQEKSWATGRHFLCAHITNPHNTFRQRSSFPRNQTCPVYSNTSLLNCLKRKEKKVNVSFIRQFQLLPVQKQTEWKRV